MTTVSLVIAVAFGLLLAEARVSRRHERALRAAGAVVPAGDRYRTLASSYAGALALMGVEGAWRAAASMPAPDATTGPSWFASGLLLFAASKALKYWAIRSLGERWTFRVMVLPGVPLVRHGPYRYVSHPNYVAVVGELLGTAMMVGALVTGPVMLAVVAAAVWMRIRFEDAALGSARHARPPSRP